MIIESRRKFSISVEELFGYFVFYLDCDKWMEYEEWNGLVLLLKEGVFSGFEIPNPDLRMGPLVSEVDNFVCNERVIYKATKATNSNVHAESRTFFPFKEMKQSLYFRRVDSGSEVLHRVEFVPKGILGWLTCRFFLRGKLISSICKSYDALGKYLSEA